MYKYLFSIIIGIILFVYYNSINKFSIGIPVRYYLYLDNIHTQLRGPYDDWNTAFNAQQDEIISTYTEYNIGFTDGVMRIDATNGPINRYTLRLFYTDRSGETLYNIIGNKIGFNDLEEAQTFLTNYYTTYIPNFDGQGNDLGDPRYDMIQDQTHNDMHDVYRYALPRNIAERGIVIRIHDVVENNDIINPIAEPLETTQTGPDGTVRPVAQPAPMPDPAPIPEPEPTTEIPEGMPPTEFTHSCASAFSAFTRV